MKYAPPMAMPPTNATMLSQMEDVETREVAGSGAGAGGAAAGTADKVAGAAAALLESARRKGAAFTGFRRSGAAR